MRKGLSWRTLQVSKDSSNAVAGTDGGTRFRRWEWGRQIGEGQAAHAWSRFLTPLYGMQIIGLLASMTYSVGSSSCCPHLQTHCWGDAIGVTCAGVAALAVPMRLHFCRLKLSMSPPVMPVSFSMMATEVCLVVSFSMTEPAEEKDFAAEEDRL